MKRFTPIIAFILLLGVFHIARAEVSAACNWTFNTAGATATTCGINSASYEMYDYDSGGDNATNGFALTIPAGVTVTVNAGTDASNLTFLGIGSLNMTGGTLIVSGNYVRVGTGPRCYVADADADGYSPTPNTCVTTAQAGYRRKSTLTAATVDCGDGNANAKPGQTTYYTTTFTNTATGLSYDWNCDGTQTKQYATAPYSCTACTNGSGYGSYVAANNGFLTTSPACGVAGTYYTVTNATCRDPAVANCSTSVSTSSVTQPCR